MQPVLMPHLPQHPVTVVVAGGGEEQPHVEALRRRGIQVLAMPANPYVSAPVATHSDLFLCHLGGEKIITAPQLDETIKTKLQNLGFDVIPGSTNLEPGYPKETAYNAAILKHRLLHKTSLTDPILLKYYQNNTLFTKQGYTKCSLVFVTDSAVITADYDIAKRLQPLGFNVLLISPGHVRLDGYPYGFLGGCCGKLAPDELAFTGHLRYHPDEAIICEFLKKHRVSPIYLTDEPVYDIGSILPIMESSKESH
jgi:hypothetical protein